MSNSNLRYVQQGTPVIFTQELLDATLDPNGNTPFTQSDVGKMFSVRSAYMNSDGIEVIHLVRDGMITRSLPLNLLIPD
jgi:hypothetical protein